MTNATELEQRINHALSETSHLLEHRDLVVNARNSLVQKIGFVASLEDSYSPMDEAVQRIYRKLQTELDDILTSLQFNPENARRLIETETLESFRYKVFQILVEDLLKKEDRNYKRDIRLDQRILACCMFGVKGNLDWLQTFNSESEIRKKMEYDRSDAVRGLIWFMLFVMFTLISLFLH